MVFFFRKSETEIELESIVIFEDDDDISIEAQPSLRNNAKPKLKTKAIERNTETSIRNQSPESRTGEARVVPIEKLLENKTTDSPLLPPTPTFFLHPLVFNSGMMTVPSLSASIMAGQLVFSARNNLIFETPELAFPNETGIEFISDPEKVTSILKKLSHQDASKVFIFKRMKSEEAVDADTSEPDSCKATAICAVGEARSLESGGREGETARESGGRESGGGEGQSLSEDRNLRYGVRGSGTPQLRSDRIDWEDKIPMDVISFVVSI